MIKADFINELKLAFAYLPQDELNSVIAKYEALDDEEVNALDIDTIVTNEKLDLENKGLSGFVNTVSFEEVEDYEEFLPKLQEEKNEYKEGLIDKFSLKYGLSPKTALGIFILIGVFLSPLIFAVFFGAVALLLIVALVMFTASAGIFVLCIGSFSFAVYGGVKGVILAISNLSAGLAEIGIAIALIALSMAFFAISREFIFSTVFKAERYIFTKFTHFVSAAYFYLFGMGEKEDNYEV